MRPRLVLLAVLTGVALADLPYYGCFTRFSRRTISNYTPIASIKMASLSTCMEHCIMAERLRGTICQSITYDKHFHSCKLFHHDGYKVPAIVHPILGVDLFTRNNTHSICAGLNGNDGKLDGNPNFHLLEKYGKSRSIPASAQKFKKQLSHDITNFRTHDVPNTGDTFSRQFHENSASPVIEVDSELSVIEKEESAMEDITQHEESLEDKCMTGNGYYVVLGTEIEKGEETDGMVQVLEDTEQGDCARLCSANVGLDNKAFGCKSLNYYPALRKCELYSIQVEPNGPGKFLANPNTIYSEKFCIPPSDRVCQKDEVFILHVQKDIKGRLINSQEAHGITPCLQICMNTKSCKTAVYKDETNMCYTYAEDLARNSEPLIDTEPGAVAIENTCSERRTKHRMLGSKTYSMKEADSTSSEWSSCKFKVNGRLVKVRFDEDGSLQVRKC